MFRLVFALALSSTLFACDKNTPPGSQPGPGPGPSTVQRSPLIHKNHVLYNRFEGISQQNACTADAGCFRGGCLQEVCTAQKDLQTTCDELTVKIPAGAQCGCMSDQCLWFTTDGSTLPNPTNGSTPTGEPGDPAGPAAPDQTCGNKSCDTGEKCIEYYGVAGPAGPRFKECGIPCHPQKGGCPEGMTCTTIADGPGPVCRRKA